MPIRVQDVMYLFSQLAKVTRMEAVLIPCGQGALVAGASAFTGGMLAGPVGVVLGGAFGGILGAWMTARQLKSVPEILLELPPAEQKKLYDAAMAILKTLNCTDAVGLIPLVIGNADLQKRFIEVLKNYFSKELNAKLKCSK